jgi:hypothetical protein
MVVHDSVKNFAPKKSKEFLKSLKISYRLEWFQNEVKIVLI